MKLNPYLNFNGNCEEALNFYKDCLDGEIVNLGRYGDSPMPASEANKNKVLHSRLKIGDNLLMASDSIGGRPLTAGTNVQLSVDWEDAAKMDIAFNKLAEGGKITMPMDDMFWGARFGMLTDKYGFHWMFNCDKKKD